MENLQIATLILVFAPLVAAVGSAFFKKVLGKQGAHWVCCSAVCLSFLCSCYLGVMFFLGANADPHLIKEFILYQWGYSGQIVFNIGFYLDRLSIIMMLVVSFVSTMVHVYTIGYMKLDSGYQRFFSYISFFTFSMLILVSSNNFLQLFFGWEGVGLASYLLIGFWFKKSSATKAGFKAFIINRIGDLGFLIGIGCILALFHSVDYKLIFEQADMLSNNQKNWMDFLCIALFVGAMGKSAQIPLHVWLPDSMEGPTPISALIHAATMVTAGVFMVARFSPLFEQSILALNIIVIIGALTCFFMGVLGLVQKDIKRIIAYSTLSQLGYMMVAVGVSSYAAGVFHLVTHAFFKALLFLGAGSVIIALHHEQNIDKMGGLRKSMPITYITMLIGTLALVGFPGFSGFYSKDLIIESAKLSTLWSANIGYYAVLLSVFVTALYSFRLLFVVFHGKSNVTVKSVSESPKVVTIPLILLAIPSVIIGIILFESVLFGEFGLSSPEALQSLGSAWHLLLHGLTGAPFWLMLSGGITAWYCYLKKPCIPKILARRLSWVYAVCIKKYGFDLFYEGIIARLMRFVAWGSWVGCDSFIIDGLIVNGLAYKVRFCAKIMQRIQTGYLYHYTFLMIAGVVGFIAWMTLR